MYNLGQPGSDRYLFMQWVSRYDDIDAVRRDNIDYHPAPLPSSVAQAIEQERTVEEAKAKQDRATELQNKKHDQEQREAELQDERQALLRSQQQEASDKMAQAARDAEQAREQPGYDACDHARNEAQGRAAPSDNGATYRTFQCEQQFPKARH